MVANKFNALLAEILCYSTRPLDSPLSAHVSEKKLTLIFTGTHLNVKYLGPSLAPFFFNVTLSSGNNLRREAWRVEVSRALELHAKHSNLVT